MSFRYRSPLMSQDIFKVDPKYLDNEARYEEIKREILGDSDDESEEEDSGSDFSDSDAEDVAPEKAGITDMTETNLINLRRTIYLTIMNSVRLLAAAVRMEIIDIPVKF